MPSTRSLGTPRIHFESIDSTNNVAASAAKKGASEGTVFVADSQTGGKGRYSKEWHSPPGQGLYFSLLLRPKLSVSNVNTLVMQSAVAMCEAIENISKLTAGIKWPNDIYLGNKKLGGILLETGIKRNNLDYAIVGIGINMQQKPEEFPEDLRDNATSIYAESNSDYDAMILLDNFLTVYSEYYYGTTECDISKWLHRCIHKEKRVRVKLNDVQYNGIFTDVAQDLSFILKVDSGKDHKIEYGELSLILED